MLLPPLFSLAHKLGPGLGFRVNLGSFSSPSSCCSGLLVPPSKKNSPFWFLTFSEGSVWVWFWFLGSGSMISSSSSNIQNMKVDNARKQNKTKTSLHFFVLRKKSLLQFFLNVKLIQFSLFLKLIYIRCF